MSQTKPHNRIKVVRTERRSPEEVRRIGRALIALARAQLEADAQAADRAAARPSKPRKQRRPS